MRIQHNIMAMNSYRNYTNNVAAMKKNLEKLSSGYKINRAGDDAAGLAISEKMRAQITGLETAQKNAKDGISLVQTAEGALTEVHDMLNRMVELATQSANGTYEDSTDRAQLQKEVDQLRSEINRIADSSNFNGIKLLDGSMSSAAGVSDVTVTAVADGLRGSGAAAANGTYTVDFTDLKVTVTETLAANATAMKVEIGGVTIGSFTVAAALTSGDIGSVLTIGDLNFTAASTSVTMGGLDFDITGTNGTITLTGSGKAGVAPTQTDVDTFNQTDLSVVITETGVKDANNGHDFAVHATTPVAAASQDKLAQGEFKLSDSDIKNGASIKIGDETYTFVVGAANKKTSYGANEINLTGFEEGDSGIAAEAARLLSKAATGNAKFHVQTIGKDGTVRLTEKAGAFTNYNEWDLQGTKGNEQDASWTNKTTGASIVQFSKAGKGLTLQIGDTADPYNQLNVNIGDMHCSSLGIAGISVANQTDAQNAISAIKNAINKVSDVRGTLGATQNRLDHTINNLSVMTENIQDAESTIRDTDVAEEMMAYTKNNILIQSAQAMLAQANQVPQGVLQLLQ